MPVDVGKRDVHNKKEEEKIIKKEKSKSVKVAQIIYGDRDLTDCMKSVIQLYMSGG